MVYVFKRLIWALSLVFVLCILHTITFSWRTLSSLFWCRSYSKCKLFSLLFTYEIKCRHVLVAFKNVWWNSPWFLSGYKKTAFLELSWIGWFSEGCFPTTLAPATKGTIRKASISAGGLHRGQHQGWRCSAVELRPSLWMSSHLTSLLHLMASGRLSCLWGGGWVQWAVLRPVAVR